MEGLGLGHGRAVSSFSRAETNSPQYRGSWLCIDGEEAQVWQIPFGIEVDFQFQIPSHPNTGIWSYLMPMPIPEAQYLHPNAT